jgi:hypothetical protein
MCRRVCQLGGLGGDAKALGYEERILIWKFTVGTDSDEKLAR